MMPTLIGLPAVFVATLIGVTVPEPWFTTYAVRLSGVNTMLRGWNPTGIGRPARPVLTLIGVAVLRSGCRLGPPTLPEAIRGMGSPWRGVFLPSPCIRRSVHASSGSRAGHRWFFNAAHAERPNGPLQARADGSI